MLKQIFKALPLTIASIGLASPIWALPSPNANGNYMPAREYHSTWRVVDPDPAGLNCRTHPIGHPRGDRILARLPAGTRIEAIGRDRDTREIALQNGNPWLNVRLNDGTRCWVRAHRKYVQAIAGVSEVDVANSDPEENYWNARLHQFWRVIDPDPEGLNCRRAPGVDFSVVGKLYKNQTISPSSAYSEPIQIDPQRQPWMAVQVQGKNCFIRAHSFFIEPVP
jgi:hypothetical protein